MPDTPPIPFAPVSPLGGSVPPKVVPTVPPTNPPSKPDSPLGGLTSPIGGFTSPNPPTGGGGGPTITNVPSPTVALAKEGRPPLSAAKPTISQDVSGMPNTSAGAPKPAPQPTTTAPSFTKPNPSTPFAPVPPTGGDGGSPKPTLPPSPAVALAKDGPPPSPTGFVPPSNLPASPAGGNNPSPIPPKSGNPIKKSPFRFVAPLLVILLVLGLGWFAVSRFLAGRQSAAPKDITLTYWGLWESNQTMAKVFAAFEASHPGVKINYVMQSHKDYRERLQAAINRGEGPDVFRFHNTWTPMLKNELSPIPKTIYSVSEFETTFFPVAQKDLKIGSNYVGIPLEFDGLALYYNQTIFKNANKTPPTTWEELRALAAQLTLRDEESRIIRGGIALGTTGNVDHWSDILGLMMLQNAANPASPKGQLAEDSLAFYTIFSKTDNVWDDTLPASTVAFAGEKAVMMIAPSWRAFDVLELNPSLKFSTVPVPQLPNTSVYWASYWAEGVSKKSSSDKQAVAWELLKFLSQPDNLQAFYTAAAETRLFGEPYPRVDMVSKLSADPVAGAYVSTAKNAQSWYLAGWTHDNGLNDRITKYYEDAVNAVVNKGASPKKALEPTAEGVVQILSQFGVSGALR